MTVKKQIYSTFIWIIGLLLIKPISLIKMRLTAGAFGAGYEWEAYILSMELPQYILMTICANFSPTFMPVLAEVRENSLPENKKKMLINI